MTDKQPGRIMRGLGRFVIPGGRGRINPVIAAHIFEQPTSKDMPKIKKFNQHIELHAEKWFHPALTYTPFIPGELYLFHRSDPGCPAEGSLWGVYDKRVKGRVYLESATEDMVSFSKWIGLPDRYRYCRLSTRAELRDYISDLLQFELQGLY